MILIVGILCFVAGIALGFFVARGAMTKYLKDNPPITEEMLRTMMGQMGLKPSQKKLNQMMKSMSKKIS